MFMLRGMLEKLRYKKCRECCWIVAKVVQGSSPDVVEPAAILYQQHGQISEITTSISNLLGFLEKLLSN